MYTVDSLKNAIHDLYYYGITRGGYESASVEDMLDSIDYTTLLQAVRHNAETVHIYTTEGRAPKSFNYRSGELFAHRATRLYEAFDQSNQSDEILADRSYELWLLEDMRLAAVARVTVAAGRDKYVTEYREISGECGDPWDSGLCLDLEELTGLLIGLCRPYCECDTPVYEL